MNVIKRRVKTLAKIHDLESKIDFDNLDDEYYAKSWESVLTKYAEFVVKAQNKKFSGLTLYNIDNVKSYNNDRGVINKVRREIHEGYTDFPNVNEIMADDVMKTVSNDNEEIGKTVTTTAYIIDADWELINGSMKILLYTRDIDSPRTNLVMCDYKDYFYIELNDEVNLGLVQKAVNGYLWYLREKRYPEAQKRFCKNRLTGTWKDKDRHEIPNSAPCDDPYFDARRHESQINYTAPLVYDITEVENLKSMYGFRPEGQRFAKITTANPIVTRHLFNGLSKKYAGGIVDTNKGPVYHPEFKFFEAGTDIINKFFTQHKLSGCVAMEVTGQVVKNNISTCQRAIEADKYSLAPDAPFYEPRVMYYDIECVSNDINVFPSADICPCIQISYLLIDGTTKIDQGVLCYKETPGYDWYETEEQMLIRFAQIILDFNPDAITGFNSNNFDMPYIIDRMRVLDIYKLAGLLSRRKNYYVDYKRTKKQSKQFGTKEIVKYVIPGRIMMDQFEIIKGDPTKRLRSYALKNICAVYLNDDNKEDLAYKEIPSLFKTPEGRKRIASYCLQDTVLLLKIDQKMMLGITAWGMTKVLGVTPDVTLNRGLVHKLMSKLKQYTERHGFVIPTFTDSQKPKFNGKYQGAFVLDPDIGYYEETDPVVVLDFTSLYPALMIGWNLCYTTILMDRNKKWMENNPDAWEMNCGVPFVKNTTHKGIVPLLEEEMAKQRKAAKKKLAAAKKKLKYHTRHLILMKKFNTVKMELVEEMDEKEFDKYIKKYKDIPESELSDERKEEIKKEKVLVGEWEVQVAVFDSEQLANKIIMNSLYGMLGSPTATVPCVEIAKTITGLGRENLLAAKDYVESNYCKITGEEKNCKVIYGDTDSIFIMMPQITIAKAIEYGQILDKRVQEDIFSKRPPMRMEYEKTYGPFIITRRKGYCGAKYELNDTEFKVAAMGFQIVRRDAAQLCTKTMKTYFDYIFKTRNKKMAADSIRLMMTELYGEYLEMDDFVITKKIAKAEYKTEPPHVTAWKRMVDRVGKAEAPAIGERFEFVVTKFNKKLKMEMRDSIIDVPLAKEIVKKGETVQYDKDYYCETFIHNPMVKIMELIHGKKETKTILDPKAYERKETVSASKNNILGFFGKKKITTKKRYRGLGFDEAFLKDVKEKRQKKAEDEGWELMEGEDENANVVAAAELTE